MLKIKIKKIDCGIIYDKNNTFVRNLLNNF